MDSSKNVNKINRRKFFISGGIAAAGFAILNSLPVRVFAKAKKKKFGITISEHPSAIKRNI